jgi:hypothetical protein
MLVQLFNRLHEPNYTVQHAWRYPFMDPKVLHVDNQSCDSMCGVSGFGREWNSHFQLWLECVNEAITMYQISPCRLPSIYIARITSDS